MTHTGFDLAASAHDEMLHEGFAPDFSPQVAAELSALRSRIPPPPSGIIRDLRDRLWSSIDNDTSRDLDQIEIAERTPEGVRVLIAIADVDSDVAIGSAIDGHAASQTTSVYTAVTVFPMLPVELSTDLTSLGPDVDRLAIVIEMLVTADGEIASSEIYRATVRNKAQLTYSGVGPWLEGTAPPPLKVSASAELQGQLKLQDEAARALRDRRHRLGALDFDRIEAQPIVSNGQVTDIAALRKNRASNLIEDFMIAANEVMARAQKDAGVSAIRRVVKTPERWPRIVDLAAKYGSHLPAEADSGALAAFLQQQKQKDEVHYPDLSLAVIKLMGPGEYILAKPGDPAQGHFGLAALDYTHSTAPNRRFADLVTQRLLKSTLAKSAAPYSDEELSAIAQNCTLKEDAARKVERAMSKRVAALAFHNRIGQSFDAVVTGVTPKGVFVRVMNPPVEGRLMRGEQGVDVGDRIRVTLLNTDPQRGFIDFSR